MTNRTDNFDRTDTTNAIGTPSDGGSDWVQLSGAWGIASNKGYESGNGSHRVATLESSIADADVQVTLATIAGGAGLIARASDDNNYILGSYGAGPSSMAVFKRVAGTFTQIGSTYTGAAANGDAFKLTINGTNLTFSQNGTSRVTGTDSHNSTVTKHGIRANASTATRFEDFSITALAGAATPAGQLIGGALLAGGKLIHGRLVG